MKHKVKYPRINTKENKLSFRELEYKVSFLKSELFEKEMIIFDNELYIILQNSNTFKL